MAVGVFLAGAVESDAGQGVEPELGGIERGMLAGQDYGGREAPRGQCAGDWRQLDRFRPGADDQPNIGETQPSP